MSVFQRTKTDGITRATETVVTAPRSGRELARQKKDLRTFVAQQNRLATFDGRVADLEQHCRQLWPGHPPAVSGAPRTLPDFGSEAWYASHILLAIAAARSAQARGEVSLAMSEAMEVGLWATEAQAKFGPWAGILLREARRRKNRELASRAAAAVREQTGISDATIQDAAAEYRDRYPDVREQSTRQMAAHIASDTRLPVGTVRHRLKILGVR